MQGRRHSFRFVKMEGTVIAPMMIFAFFDCGTGERGAVLRVLRLRSEGIVEFS